MGKNGKVIAIIELCTTPLLDEMGLEELQPGITKYGNSFTIKSFTSITKAVEEFWSLPPGYISERYDGEFYAVEHRLKYFSFKEKQERTIYTAFHGSLHIIPDDDEDEEDSAYTKIDSLLDELLDDLPFL